MGAPRHLRPGHAPLLERGALHRHDGAPVLQGRAGEAQALALGFRLLNLRAWGHVPSAKRSRPQGKESFLVLRERLTLVFHTSEARAFVSLDCRGRAALSAARAPPVVWQREPPVVSFPSRAIRGKK